MNRNAICASDYEPGAIQKNEKNAFISNFMLHLKDNNAKSVLQYHIKLNC